MFKLFIFKRIFFGAFLGLGCVNLNAEGQGLSGDPYGNTNHRDAFDQVAIWSKHCQINNETPKRCEVEESRFDQDLVDDFLRKKYRHAQIPLISMAKTTLGYTLSMIPVLGLGHLALRRLNVADTVGVGLGVTTIANSIANLMSNLIQHYFGISGYKGDPLLPYELSYAKLKRRLPPAVWEQVESRFMEARRNPYARQKHLEFFNTLFSLPSESKARTTTIKEFVRFFDEFANAFTITSKMY